MIGVVDVVAIGGRDGAAKDLMHAHEQLGGGFSTEEFVDKTIHFGVTVRIDCGRAHLVLGKTFAQRPGSIGVIENVAAGFEFHLVVRNPERPRAKAVHEATLKIEKPQQAPTIFLHVELAAKLSTVDGETKRIARAALGGGFALAGETLRGDDGFISGSGGVCGAVHGVKKEVAALNRATMMNYGERNVQRP